MSNIDFNENPHRRLNILTGEWVLVSPHRTKRPWQGKNEEPAKLSTITYDENCYLCPTNERAGGAVNPDYKEPFAFTNDFAALLQGVPNEKYDNGFFQAETETGICKVICFSPNHALTLPLMEAVDIKKVIDLWQKELKELGANEDINYVQIFENKGGIMGCSNPHPQFLKYWNDKKESLLEAYLAQELEAKERILVENEYFVALVPYWAVWPYETMIVPRKKHANITTLSEEEKLAYAEIIKALTTKYDNIFKTSFPYSAGIHQAPTDGEEHPEWHMHMSFYPPLLRSATVKKFMVGYEMFANPQRDITAEQAAEKIRSQSQVHYSKEL